ELQPHLFADRPGQEATDAVGLPPGGFHQLLQAGPIRAFEQVENFSHLAAVAGGAGLLGALGRFLRGAGLLGRLALLWRNIGATCPNTGLLSGSWRLTGRRGCG